MPRFKLLLISGAGGVGKTTLLRKIGASVDSLTQIVDVGDFRSFAMNSNITIDGKSPSEEFWLRTLHAAANIDTFKDLCAEIQTFLIEPIIKSSILRRTEACVVTSGHIIPGRFDQKKFPDIDIIEILLVISDKEQHWRRYGERQKRRSNNPLYDKTQNEKAKFEKCRTLQEYMIQCAQKAGVQIIENDEQALGAIVKQLGGTKHGK